MRCDPRWKRSARNWQGDQCDVSERAGCDLGGHHGNDVRGDGELQFHLTAVFSAALVCSRVMATSSEVQPRRKP